MIKPVEHPMILSDYIFAVFVLSLDFVHTNTLDLANREIGHVDCSTRKLGRNYNPSTVNFHCNSECGIKTSESRERYAKIKENIYEEIPDDYDHLGFPYNRIPNATNSFDNEEDIHTRYRKFLGDLKEGKNLSDFFCIKRNGDFEKIYDLSGVKFSSIRFYKRNPDGYIFFYKFKRTLIDLMIFVDDYVQADYYIGLYDCSRLYSTLVTLYKIFFTDVDIKNYFAYDSVKFLSYEEGDRVAIEVLNKLFFPSEIPKDTKTTKLFLRRIKRNRERYPDLKKGFKLLDFISYKLKSQSHIYTPRYYILTTILLNTVD